MKDFRIGSERPVLAKRLDRYLSFPVMVRLDEDRALVAYRDAESAPGTRSHGRNGDTRLIRWRDGRWSEPELLYTHESDVEEMGIDMTRLSAGTICLVTRQWSDRLSRTHEVYLAISTDNGATFGARRPMQVEGLPRPWQPYGKIVEPPGGDWLLGAYCKGAGGEGFSAACLKSTDRGRSWRRLSWVARSNCVPGVEFSEVFLMSVPDGSLLAMLRSDGTMYRARSSDAGRSWDEPRAAFRGMACAGLVLSDGRVLVCHRGIHERPADVSPSEPVWCRSGRLYCAHLSEDGGETWGDRMEIDSGEAWQIGSYGMGDLIELAGGVVRVVYYTSDSDQASWLEERQLMPV